MSIKKLGLNNNQLKIIAMITMIIDHIGVAFFPGVAIFRILGRISFPIFAYMIAEGCRYTQNRKKYLGIILSMAILFQVFYFVFMNDLYQCIFVTFSLSIATIFSIDSFINNKKVSNRILMVLTLVLVVFVGIIAPILFEKYGFHIDYGTFGIALPILIYFAPTKLFKLIFATVLIISMAIFSSALQWWALLSIPFLALYNGERGKAKMKYFFYIFYPVHLVIIYGIMILLAILNQ